MIFYQVLLHSHTCVFAEQLYIVYITHATLKCLTSVHTYMDEICQRSHSSHHVCN